MATLLMASREQQNAKLRLDEEMAELRRRIAEEEGYEEESSSGR
jgi:hypothetical protein